MKNKLFNISTAIVAISLISSSLFAQDSKIRIGVHVSPTIAWLKSNTTGYSGGSKVGFSYGVVTDFGFTENYAFSTGVDITYKGGTFKKDGDASGSLDLQYVEVPLTLKLRTNLIGNLRYYAQVGVGLSAKLKSPDSSNIYPLGAALIIGGGLEFPINGNTALVGGLTFNNGFTNIIRDNPDNAKASTSYLALNLGILF
jgi:hypothetical protein